MQIEFECLDDENCGISFYINLKDLKKLNDRENQEHDTNEPLNTIDDTLSCPYCARSVQALNKASLR